MAQLNLLLHRFVYRHFFIALCAVGMVFSTLLMNGIAIEWSHYTIFLMLSTFILYNFHVHSFQLNYTDLKKFKASFQKLQLSASVVFMYTLALVFAVYELSFFNSNLILWLVPLTIFTLLYSIPAWGIKNKVRIRESVFIKVPIIGLVWSLSTVILPLVEQNIDLGSPFVIKQIVCRFLFVFALCIPFEIRDLEIDSSQNVKTIASELGIKATKNFGIFLLILEILIHHTMEIPLKTIIALDMSSVFAIVWILILKKNMGVYFYKLFVDGTMVLRFLFLYLASIFL